MDFDFTSGNLQVEVMARLIEMYSAFTLGLVFLSANETWCTCPYYRSKVNTFVDMIMQNPR